MSIAHVCRVLISATAVAVGLELALAYLWLVYGPMPGDVAW